MLRVLPQDTEQVSCTQDQHVIQHLPADVSDQSLGVSVGLRGPIRGEHDTDTFGGEHRIEAERVLGIAIAEQEPYLYRDLGLFEIHH